VPGWNVGDVRAIGSLGDLRDLESTAMAKGIGVWLGLCMITVMDGKGVHAWQLGLFMTVS
jgi:hypothetical protein